MPDDRTAPAPPAGEHPHEPHSDGRNNRLNSLRAFVLGANDGIVSVAAVVVGVAGATQGIGPIATAGLAALVGGAISMALGEYVSVSSQRDSERTMIAKEKAELHAMPDEELGELAQIYQDKGLSPQTARQVAVELTEHDALTAHLDAELNIDPGDVVSPWGAASASAIAFTVGGLLPFLAAVLVPEPYRVPVTFAIVLVALALAGISGARLGRTSWPRPTVRVVLGGALALAVTFGLGSLLGTTGVAG